MKNDKLKHIEKRRLIRKARAGRFEVTFWRWTKTLPPSQNRRGFAERPVEVNHPCLRYSTWNGEQRTWNEQFIWCNVEDLHDLVRAIDEISTSAMTDQETHDMMQVLSEVKNDTP